MPVTPTKSKSKGARFVRFYPSDWRSGCLGLTLEQQGLYVSICAFQWETGRRIFADDTQAAHALGLNPKNYRKVRDQLLQLGKIEKHEDGYSNARAEAELNAALGAGAGSRRQAEDVDVGASRDVHSAQEDGGNQISERPAGQDSIADQSPVNSGSIDDQSTIMMENSIENQTPFIEPIADSQKPIENPVVPIDLRRLFQPADENLGVIVSEGGTIKLTGDLLAFWLGQFGDNQQRLDLALRSVSIQPNSRTPIRAQVERQLSFRAADKLDRDQRYQAAAAANKPEKKPFRPSRWALG